MSLLSLLMNLMHILVKIKTLKLIIIPTDPNSRVCHIFILFPQIYAKMLDQMNNEVPKGKQLLLCFEACLFWRAGIAQVNTDVLPFLMRYPGSPAALWPPFTSPWTWTCEFRVCSVDSQRACSFQQLLKHGILIANSSPQWSRSPTHTHSLHPQHNREH